MLRFDNLKNKENMIVKNESELRELIDRALQVEAVALDTEFVWERTFYPDLGLVQLAIGRDCYLIDPLEIEDMSALGELLAAPGVTKILHDALQDLTILKRATGATPVNIFDTRSAYGFCSDSSILSLSALLEKTLDVQLPKTETRTNWLRRPLSPEQLEYACDDVKYMCEVRELIIRLAEANNTEAWLAEEMKFYDAPEIYEEIEPEDYFRKVKGTDRLNREQLAVLQELSAWRERTAREVNWPRGHVIHNNTLLDLTWKRPTRMVDLKRISRFHPKAIEIHGQAIIESIETALDKPEHLHPEQSELMRDKELNKQADKLVKAIQEKAEELNIDSALIGSKKEIKSFVYSEKYEEASGEQFFHGWRHEFMQDILNN
jgi:ribonuclease D